MSDSNPDAHCPDCPFADRGDWVIYRHEFDSWMRELADLRARVSAPTEGGGRDEYEALLRDRERAIETRENANAVSVRVEGENRRLLNIINVAAEYLRDPERDPAEGRALAALALDKAGEASDD